MERPVHHRLRQLAARVVDPQQGRHRGPCVRSEIVRVFLVRIGCDGPGCQRRTDSRSPVSCPEASHPELGRGHELDQIATRPTQRVRLEVHRDLLSEREIVEAGVEVDDRAVGGREGARESAIVEVGRDAQTGVELVRPLPFAAGEQERPGADHRFEIEAPLPRTVGVPERQLREREQGVVTPPSLSGQLVQGLECTFGIPPEALGQVAPVEHVLAERARAGGIERALRELLRDDARGDPCDAHRWSTGRQQERGGDGTHCAHEAANHPPHWPAVGPTSGARRQDAAVAPDARRRLEGRHAPTPEEPDRHRVRRLPRRLVRLEGAAHQQQGSRVGAGGRDRTADVTVSARRCGTS